jgi:hypothetical protein
VTITTPAGETECCLPPSRPSSPSHSHSPAVPPSTSLERYWPLIAVTICSLYLITIMPFMAPGLFLVQFSLLRYIQQQKKDKATKDDRKRWERAAWLRPEDDGGLLRRRESRLKQPPVMDAIPEETHDEIEQEAAPAASSASSSDSLPALPRPPPLIIPDCQLGVITAPWPADDRAFASSSLPLAASSSPCSSSAWSHDLNESLQSLLQSSLLSPPSSSSSSSSNLLAATAAFFSPSLFQSLTAASSTAASSPPAELLSCVCSVPCPPHGVHSVHRAFSFSQHCQHSASRPSGAEQLSVEEELETGAAPQRLRPLDERLRQQEVLCM